MLPDQSGHDFHFIRGHLEYQFVMYLQQHAPGQSLFPDGTVDPHHGQFDQVGGRALERRVLSVALTVRAQTEVSFLDFRNVPATLEERLHITLLPGKLDLAVQERADAREALEVPSDKSPGIVQRDPKLPAQGKGALAIDGSEVDGLGPGSHVPG